MNKLLMLRNYMARNKKNLCGYRIKEKGVYLEWWDESPNLGDCLAPVIFDWMIKQNNIDLHHVKQKVHLMTIGSLVGAARFDSVIWGSGIMNAYNLSNMIKHRKYVKYDLRAVRGPLTAAYLKEAGYNLEGVVYGDPGVLMPLIYNPQVKKKYKYGLISHHTKMINYKSDDCKTIDIRTSNYQSFINDILSCDKILSASLHGIILAESYNIPAVFINDGVNDQIMKYIDWYYSTNRFDFRSAATVEQAIQIEPMELPNLDKMRENLLKTFPIDLWT